MLSADHREWRKTLTPNQCTVPRLQLSQDWVSHTGFMGFGHYSENIIKRDSDWNPQVLGTQLSPSIPHHEALALENHARAWWGESEKDKHLLHLFLLF